MFIRGRDKGATLTCSDACREFRFRFKQRQCNRKKNAVAPILHNAMKMLLKEQGLTVQQFTQKKNETPHYRKKSVILINAMKMLLKEQGFTIEQFMEGADASSAI